MPTLELSPCRPDSPGRARGRCLKEKGVPASMGLLPSQQGSGPHMGPYKLSGYLIVSLPDQNSPYNNIRLRPGALVNGGRGVCGALISSEPQHCLILGPRECAPQAACRGRGFPPCSYERRGHSLQKEQTFPTGCLTPEGTPCVSLCRSVLGLPQSSATHWWWWRD